MSVDSGPAGSSKAVTTHDTNAQPVGRALFVGGTGNITGRLVDDSVDTVWTGIPAGSILALRFAYIRATGTTATLMNILF
jgi:hypothetical protein